jgi:hypothetical protein
MQSAFHISMSFKHANGQIRVSNITQDGNTSSAYQFRPQDVEHTDKALLETGKTVSESTDNLKSDLSLDKLIIDNASPVRGLDSVLDWKYEIIFLTVALAFLTSIAVVLAKFNYQKQPNWPYSINLSSLVALLSTFLRAALLAVLDSCE